MKQLWKIFALLITMQAVTACMHIRDINLVATIATPTPTPLPTPRFAYVANSGGNTVSMYTVNATSGALTPLAGLDTNTYVSTGAGTEPYSIAADPTGRFVYVTYATGFSIGEYSIDQTTGALSPIGLGLIGSGNPGLQNSGGLFPVYVTIDPSGRFLYVRNSSALLIPGTANSTITIYSIDPTTGALSFVGSIAAGKGLGTITVHPSGKFLYTVNKDDTLANDIFIYTINPSSGALSLATTPTATAEIYASYLTIDSQGLFAYVVNEGSDTVSMFSINQSSGALTPVTTFATGSNPDSFAIDPTGRFSYVANFGSVSSVIPSTMSMYSRDQSNGALSAITGSPLATPVIGSGSTIVDPSGKFVYVITPLSNIVTLFSIDQTTGALTSVGNTATGNTPFSITVTR